MARILNAVCRLCRREGMKLYLKGPRCDSPKCALEKRNYPPGMHGRVRRKLSEYGLQLRETQRLKRFYGISDRQFQNYYAKAERQKGNTGENLLIMLERRLDNVVYLVGFAISRRAARQMIVHGHILVNGRKVDIPSKLVEVGEVISVKEGMRKEIYDRPSAHWFTVDKNKFEAKILALPTREDISINIREQLVVEFCSK